MAESKRKFRGNAGLAASAVTALILGAALFTDAVHDERMARFDAQKRAVDYATAARVDVRPACEANKLDRDKCAQAAVERARPAQRDEYDLQAQLTMAAWTRAMGLAALVGMAVGILGLGLIYRTWDATREAAESSRKTLRAYIAKERAVIRPVDWLEFYISDNQPHLLTGFLKLSNYGSGGAVIEQIRYCMQEEGEWPAAFDSRIDESAFVETGGQSSAFRLKLNAVAPSVFFLLGEIEYTTLADERFVARFCYHAELLDSGNLGGASAAGRMRKFPSTPQDT